MGKRKVAVAAINGLEKLRDHSSIPVLIAAYETSHDGIVKTGALSALRHMIHSEAPSDEGGFLTGEEADGIIEVARGLVEG